MEITKKINHDSLWIRVKTDAGIVKLTINRRGYRITSTREAAVPVAKEVGRLYNEAVLTKKMSYGDALDYIEAELAKGSE